MSRRLPRRDVTVAVTVHGTLEHAHAVLAYIAGTDMYPGHIRPKGVLRAQYITGQLIAPPEQYAERAAAQRQRIAELEAAAGPADPRIVALENQLAAARKRIAELEALHETPCPGRCRDAGTVIACGGYIGHPGDCAPYWSIQDGWRTPYRREEAGARG